MKHLIVTLAMALMLATPAMAEIDAHEVCSDFSSFAETVMTNRQSNIPMQAMMGTTESELLRSVIADAYSQPRWSVPENRQNAIHEFRDKWYLGCHERFIREQ